MPTQPKRQRDKAKQKDTCFGVFLGIQIVSNVGNGILHICLCFKCVVRGGPAISKNPELSLLPQCNPNHNPNVFVECLQWSSMELCDCVCERACGGSCVSQCVFYNVCILCALLCAQSLMWIRELHLQVLAATWHRRTIGIVVVCQFSSSRQLLVIKERKKESQKTEG